MNKEATSRSCGLHQEAVRVWDWPVRIFHWLLLVLVIAAYLTSRYNWMTYHVYIGRIILTLLCFRTMWGFWGSDTARFRRFIVRPSIAFAYIRDLFSQTCEKHIGHTPAGGWMVVALIVVLWMQVLTGLFVSNDVVRVGPLFAIFSGDTTNTLVFVHGILFNVLTLFVAIHIAVVAIYWTVKRQNLIKPMITGIQSLPLCVEKPRFVSTKRAIGLFLCSIGIALLIGLL
ncbi:cytochrome b/b6 domain-containing protein [Burkholderia sp. Ac-20365]|uniref:cytochrome b/b6 domain-containing protein n=1 Tax=Burkholderia sp. Ac-20365 TaxID=2703897 RepID=UPI00197C6337|nr:hydrogenase [Burkholderia sp. Ac-20365]